MVYMDELYLYVKCRDIVYWFRFDEGHHSTDSKENDQRLITVYAIIEDKL